MNYETTCIRRDLASTQQDPSRLCLDGGIFLQGREPLAFPIDAVGTTVNNPRGPPNTWWSLQCDSSR